MKHPILINQNKDTSLQAALKILIKYAAILEANYPIKKDGK